MADRNLTPDHKFRTYLLTLACILALIAYLRSAPPPDDYRDAIFGFHPAVIDPNYVPPYLQPPPCPRLTCRDV